MTESLACHEPLPGNPMINRGRDTSAKKTHLFNWLYNITVQMGQPCVYVHFKYVCVCPQCFHLFMLGWVDGGGDGRIRCVSICMYMQVACMCPYN